MAWQSGAVERLRGFPSPDVLLRMLMLHVARGYSLRETVVRAKLANWTDISDVALLKRLHREMLALQLERLQLIDTQIAKLNNLIAQAMKPHQEAVMRLAEVPGLGGGFGTADNRGSRRRSQYIFPGGRSHACWRPRCW